MPAGRRHGELAARLNYLLYAHVYERGLGKVYADQTTYVLQSEGGAVRRQRVPDVSFVRAEHIVEAEEPEDYWYRAPDLAVEVVSPTETARDIRGKVRDYLDGGASEVWVVYPDTEEVEVHRAAEPNRPVILRGQDVLTSENLLPGFSLSLPTLFV